MAMTQHDHPAETTPWKKPAQDIPLAAGALYAWSIRLTPALGAVMSASTVIVAINAHLLRLKNDQPLKKGETT